MTQPALARHERGLGRVYWSDRAERDFPSITNVIGMKDKPALKPWAAKLVAEYAVNDLDFVARLAAKDRARAVDWLKSEPFEQTAQAGKRGDAVHGYLEDLMLGRTPRTLSGPAATFKKAADDFLVEWKPEPVHIEQTVFSETHGYAGTFDFIARLANGALVLGDYKTSKRVYPETALQLAAIRFADRMELGDGIEHAVPDVDECVTVLLTPDGYELRPMGADWRTFECFLALLRVWEWDRRVPNKEKVGPKLRPPVPAKTGAL